MMLDVDVRLDRAANPLAYAFRAEAPVTGVFGPSGAGKTSLLAMIAGLLSPTRGAIRLDDRTLVDRAAGVDLPPHRRGIGVVFQEGRLFPHLTVRGNLHYGRRREGPRLPEADVVDLLGLAPLLARRVHRLSGGERQRVALARALLSGPRLLLLDEPLASVDRAHTGRILGLFRQVRDAFGVPMLYVSHDLEELLQLTDRLVIVEGGRAVGHGPLRTLAREAASWSVLCAMGPRNVLTARVVAGDDGGLARLVLLGDGTASDGDAGPSIVAPPCGAGAGTMVRLSIRAEDVALARGPIEGISIRNQLAGRVIDVTRHDDRSLAEVEVGPAVLLVEVSHGTVTELALEAGRPIHCLIKSNAVSYLP